MNKIIILIFLLLALGGAQADEEITIADWIDIFIDTCVGSGSKFIASGEGKAGVDISLKKFRLDGTLAGAVNIKKSEYRLLTDGISNAMTKVAADQADKVRDCLAPVRQNLLRIMQGDMAPDFYNEGSVPILSPYEESVMRLLSSHKGVNGKTGRDILTRVVLAESQMSDIRLDVVIASLADKGLIIEHSTGYMKTDAETPSLVIEDIVLSLSSKGLQYVLEMGYAD